MERVLVTGVNGFTGRYVAARFAAAGRAVHGTGSQPAADPALPLAGYRRADLGDVDALAAAIRAARPQVVVHLAAIAAVSGVEADAYRAVNVEGTRNLLEALRREGPPLGCVLVASSANVYGAAEGVVSEATPLAPANDYARSKAAMEGAARSFAADLPLVIARPFNYTGRGQTEAFVIPKIVNAFRRGDEAVELGALDVHREFFDVRALADAYLRLVEARPVGEAVNVATGTGHSLREVLAMAAAHAGRPLAVRPNPALLRRNEIPRLVGDASRLRALAPGWSAPPFAETLGWMLDEPWEAARPSA